MTNFKVGDKVRILSLDGALAGFKIGDEAVIKQSKLDGSKEGGAATYSVTNGKAYGYCDAIHIELVNAQPTKKQRISTLEAQVAELKAELASVSQTVEALKQAQGKALSTDKLSDAFRKLAETTRKKPSLTPNELRKAIIAEARAFVAEHSPFVKIDRTPLTRRVGDVRVIFEVNEKKRSVVALAKLAHVSDKYGSYKGVAKCAPGDVFNADIGKAIALGRALGLDVSKFEQAVQPTKYANGQVITFPNTDSWHRRYNYRIDDVKATTGNLTKLFEDGGKANAGLSDPNGNKLEIIDDTEAQYD